MINILGTAHFSIPVSDLKKSIAFYTDVVGCQLIENNDDIAFMDAGGLCVILCREAPPINKSENYDFVHHSFSISKEQFESAPEHLAKYGVEVLESHDRQGGTVNGPRMYFRDPDGTRLEFIHLTSYDTTPGKMKAAAT